MNNQLGYLSYLSHNSVKKMVPESKSLIEEYCSEGEWRVYDHANSHFLLIVPEVHLYGIDDLRKYFESLEININRLDVMPINDCNAALIERKPFEGIFRPMLSKWMWSYWYSGWGEKK